MYTGPVMEDDRDADDGTAGGAPDAAFAQLYQDYFGRIYDFSIRLAQDREIAALVVQSTFLRAYRGLRGAQQTGLDLQLFSGAHHDTAERLRGRRGAAEQIEEPYAAIDTSRLSSPVDDAQELGRMVWSAAIELKLNDYELLDLNVRQQLNANDIGAVLGARPESVERRLADAHNALEQALTARRLFTRGRRECLDLDFQLGETEWSSSLSRRILRHADSCTVCRTSPTDLPAARELLAALMPVPAPATWQETILERLQEAVKSEPVPPAASAATPAAAQAPEPSSTPASAPTFRPTPAQRPSSPLPEFGRGGRGGGSIADWFDSIFGGGGPRGPLLAALLGGLLAIGIVLGSLCAAGTFDGGGDDEPAPTGTVTTTPTAEASGTQTTTTTPTQTPTQQPGPEPTEPPQPQPTEPPLPTATESPPTATEPTLAPPPTEPAPTETAPAPTKPAATPTP